MIKTRCETCRMFFQIRNNDGFCLDAVPFCLTGYNREHMAKRYALSMRSPKDPSCDRYEPKTS